MDVESWIPKTETGRKVKNGEITSLEEILLKGMPLMEVEIVDYFLPDMEEEVLDVNMVQKMSDSGRKRKFRAVVIIGNKNGFVGVGKGKAKEVGPAIRKAIQDAKLNLIMVKRGCGSWECGCGSPHSVPFRVTGKSGSVRMTLLPAPRGIGLAIADGAKSVLRLAGIKDVWSITEGETRTEINLAQATFNALREITRIKMSENARARIGVIYGATGEGE